MGTRYKSVRILRKRLEGPTNLQAAFTLVLILLMLPYGSKVQVHILEHWIMFACIQCAETFSRAGTIIGVPERQHHRQHSDQRLCSRSISSLLNHQRPFEAFGNAARVQNGSMARSLNVRQCPIPHRGFSSTILLIYHNSPSAHDITAQRSHHLHRPRPPRLAARQRQIRSHSRRWSRGLCTALVRLAFLLYMGGQTNLPWKFESPSILGMRRSPHLPPSP